MYFIYYFAGLLGVGDCCFGWVCWVDFVVLMLPFVSGFGVVVLCLLGWLVSFVF